MTEHAKMVHVIEMIVIISLGLLPSVIIVSTSGYQIDGSLPDLCVPRGRSEFFYTFSLPIVIGATIGLSMLLTAFWILRQVSYIMLMPTLLVT